jgi:hypothetical protein
MRALAFLLIIVASQGALSGEKLDDAGSPRSRVDTTVRWLHTNEGLTTPELINAMVATVPNLEFRLDTSRYVGKKARIYLVVPDFMPGLRSPSGLRVEWKTRGAFLAGSALPGTRALVYDGTIKLPSMHEALDLSIYLDARYFERGLRVEPRFEIDVLP